MKQSWKSIYAKLDQSQAQILLITACEQFKFHQLFRGIGHCVIYKHLSTKQNATLTSRIMHLVFFSKFNGSRCSILYIAFWKQLPTVPDVKVENILMNFHDRKWLHPNDVSAWNPEGTRRPIDGQGVGYDDWRNRHRRFGHSRLWW